MSRPTAYPSSTPPQRYRRVAVVGGDGRPSSWRDLGRAVRVFTARRYGGNGELRRLERALKTGTYDHVFILARWNSHSTTRRVLALCRRRSIPVTVIP